MRPTSKLLLLTVFSIKSLVSGENSNDVSIVFKNVPEDGRLNFTQLAHKYGQQCEEHTVRTEDGYLLKLFNIPGDKTKPVYLMHGTANSADSYIIRGNISTAITLAREGYDVWVGNKRGNKYSRHHETLDPESDKKQFWNFTFHEIAVYDLPAAIDYILNATGQEQLQVIGHSQGNMIFYILGSERPEYNDKIKLAVALAPICYLTNIRSLGKLGLELWPAFKIILGEGELVPSPIHDIITFICSQNELGYDVCAKGMFFPAAGFDVEELEPEFFRALVGRYPDTTSTKDIDHMAQIKRRRQFSKYDYGVLRNLKVYGSMQPPDYDLKKVTMPVALIASKNDNLSALKDVDRLRGQLPNVVTYHVMEREAFNHMDHTWGKHMPQYLYPLLLDLLKKYS